jgi:hypothetical protein
MDVGKHLRLVHMLSGCGCGQRNVEAPMCSGGPICHQTVGSIWKGWRLAAELKRARVEPPLEVKHRCGDGARVSIFR